LVATGVVLLIAIAFVAARNDEPKSGSKRYTGMCDASAAVALDEHRFVVANDEDNVLRVYDVRVGGAPVAQADLALFLQAEMKEGVYRESDVEGAAWLGKRVFWITSHGRNKDGKERPTRYRFFAVEPRIEGERIELAPSGKPYMQILDDLLADKRLAKYNLSTAAERAPKKKNSLNLEGLAATPDGKLLIGFRNPIPKGRAIILPLENAAELVDDAAARAKFGDPIELDLSDRGVRAMEYVGGIGKYLIVAGSHDKGGDFDLYSWSGRAADGAERVRGIDFQDRGPESIVVYPNNSLRLQLLSDDGTHRVEGGDCKTLADPARRFFRDLWVDLSR
jgi:hypothetical protein